MAIRKLLLAVMCAGLVVGCSTGQSAHGDLSAPESGGMKLMSYNVMHCAGADNKVDIARTAEVIKRENPRFVGVQELDFMAKHRSGGVDQPAELGRLTGMYATFAQAIPYQGGGYGVAVLSREKPISVFKTALPGREEIRLTDDGDVLEQIILHYMKTCQCPRYMEQAKVRICHDRWHGEEKIYEA